MHFKSDRVKVGILCNDDEKICLMLGNIKREYLNDAMFTWPRAKDEKACHCSRQDVKPTIKK